MEKRVKHIEDLPRDSRGGFSVPDGYFSDLHHRLADISSTTTELTCATTPSRAVFGRKRLYYYMFGFSAVAAVLFCTIHSLFTDVTHGTEYENEDYYIMSLYNITTEDILYYTNTYEADISVDASAYLTDISTLDLLDVCGYDITEITQSSEITATSDITDNIIQ